MNSYGKLTLRKKNIVSTNKMLVVKGASTILVSIVLSISLIISLTSNLAYGQDERFVANVSREIFAPGDTIIVYGKVVPKDSLVVRLFDPTGKVARLETVIAEDDGTFTKQFFVWPEPSKTFPFGSYSVEIRSTIIPSDIETKLILFVDRATLGGLQPGQPTPALSVKLDSPTQVAKDSRFRIFVQVTFNNALLRVAPEELVNLLGSSHIHSDSENTTINLSGKFTELHEGLYFADVTLPAEGSYIIHAVAFHKGLLSHDSRVVVSSSGSIGSIQESVNTLNANLDQTNIVLNDTRTSLIESVEGARATIRSEVEGLSQASGQLNSIILPVLALISIIIALQISLFARIRASYR